MIILIAIYDYEDIFVHDVIKSIDCFVFKENVNIELHKFESTKDLLNNRDSEKYDLLILNPCVPDINIVEYARKFKFTNEDCLIVLIAKNNDYALIGYEIPAFRYYILPDKLHLYDWTVELFETISKTKPFIRTEINGTQSFLSARVIKYIESTMNNTYLHMQNNSVLCSPKNLDSFEVQPSLSHFIRINQGCLINPEYIFKRQGKKIFLEDKTEFLISRSYYNSVKIQMTKI